MARKITMNGQSRKAISELFDDFVLSRTAQGLSEITLTTYRHHIHSISYHLDIQKPMEALTRKDLEAMVVSMRRAGLAHNSISSYCRVLRTFLNWCKRNEIATPELPNIKDKETIKEGKLLQFITTQTDYPLQQMTVFRQQYTVMRWALFADITEQCIHISRQNAFTQRSSVWRFTMRFLCSWWEVMMLTKHGWIC